MGRILALRYFAGLRTAEACRLREEDIHLDWGFVEVTALKSKTRQRRLVSIGPALAAWLERGGRLPITQANERFAALARLAAVKGVPWPHNATRHSFVSYHLAAGESAGKTALESGHSEAILFAHYRAVVTKEQAQSF